MDGHKGLRVLAVFFRVLTASASGIQVLVTPPEPPEQQRVLLNVAGITDRILFSEWYLGSEINADYQILRYNNVDGSQNQGKEYFNKAEIYSNSSLLISNITKDLEGNYTVFIQGISQSYQQTAFVKVIVVALPGIIKIVNTTINQNDVLLNVRNIPEDIYYSEWFKGNQLLASNQIVRYNKDGSIIKGSQFFNEAEIQSNGSLVIKKFSKVLEGNYTVHIQGDNRAYKDTIYLKSLGLSVSGSKASICITIFATIVAAVTGVLHL